MSATISALICGLRSGGTGANRLLNQVLLLVVVDDVLFACFISSSSSPSILHHQLHRVVLAGGAVGDHHIAGVHLCVHATVLGDEHRFALLAIDSISATAVAVITAAALLASIGGVCGGGSGGHHILPRCGQRDGANLIGELPLVNAHQFDLLAVLYGAVGADDAVRERHNQLIAAVGVDVRYQGAHRICLNLLSVHADERIRNGGVLLPTKLLIRNGAVVEAVLGIVGARLRGADRGPRRG
ncbi:hypothetical protein TYRP_006735 [Tyrophagus putrescentiae]|nr:hypothetical protein TYRP_006735 [Tyrophagus putrescentiae]